MSAAVFLVALWCVLARGSLAIGVNWGTQLSHPLPASTVVRMLQDNGFDRVKLFDAEDGILRALRKSGLQVMVGIPNDMLAALAADPKAADNWVARNVTGHVHDGVDIRSVALVPLPRRLILKTCNAFAHLHLVAVKNIFFTCMIIDKLQERRVFIY